MHKIKFNKYQKMTMVAMPLAIMFNPLTIQIYMDYVIRVLEGVSVLATVYTIGFLLYNVLKPQSVNISTNGEPQEYIET